MTTPENKKILTLVTIFLVCLTFTSPVYSQTEKETIANLISKLDQKVLLTEEQSEIIEANLFNYFNDTSEANLKSVRENIETLLDSKQTVKYNIIKNDWWKLVTTEVMSLKSQKTD